MIGKLGQPGVLGVMGGLEETPESGNGFAEGKPGPVRGVRESVQEEPEYVGCACRIECITLVIGRSYKRKIQKYGISFLFWTRNF